MADRFIDRTHEQKRFGQMVACRSKRRVMTVKDASGRGKSRLLRQLRLTCQTRNVPVCLIPLDDLNKKTAYELVEKAEAELVATGLAFPTFADVQDRRLQASLGGAPVGAAHADDNKGVVAGVYAEAGSQVTFFGGRVPADLDERMQRDAVGAFLADLQAHCDQRPVVVLLDAYEQVDGEVDVFLTGFLSACVAHPERFDKLVVVIAGQHVPTEVLELAYMARYRHAVEAIDELSRWEREHVQQFLEDQLKSHSEMDLEYLHGKIEAEGWSIHQAKMLLLAIQQQGA
jgi:hypothetical protein